jgi:hypothetical protein
MAGITIVCVSCRKGSSNAYLCLYFYTCIYMLIYQLMYLFDRCLPACVYMLFHVRELVLYSVSVGELRPLLL